MKAAKSRERSERPARLDQGEWDFYELPREQVHVAFFYEYARSSTKMRKAFRQLCREMAQEPFKNAAWVGPSLLSQPLRDHHLLPVLYWLWHVNLRKIVFPEKSFYEARTLVSVDWLRWTPGPKGRSMAGPSPIGFMDVWADDFGRLKTGKMGIGEAGIEYRFAETVVKAAPHESIFVLNVNWQTSDPAIEQALKQFILRRRPAAFAHLAKPAPQQQSGLDGLKFPFRKSNALDWLGVHRRRNAVTTWREFFETYDPTALQELKKAVVKSRDISDLARPREADFRKAKLILDWFDSGTLLKKEDFK